MAGISVVRHFILGGWLAVALSYHWIGLLGAEEDGGDRQFSKALSLIQKDHERNRLEALFWLQKAREGFSGKENLNEADSQKLQKILAYTRWQRSLDDGNPAEAPASLDEDMRRFIMPRDRRAGNEDSVVKVAAEDDDVSAENPARMTRTRRPSEEPKMPEKKPAEPAHPEPVAKAQPAMDAEPLDGEIRRWAETLDPPIPAGLADRFSAWLKEMPNYRLLRRGKLYSELARQIADKLAAGGVQDDIAPLAEIHRQDLLSWAALRERIQTEGKRGVRFRNSRHGIDGTVSSADGSGLHLDLIYENHREAFVGWELIGENDLMDMGLQLLESRNTAEIQRLAVLGLRYGDLPLAHILFEHLAAFDPEHREDYARQLVLCERLFVARGGGVILDEIQRRGLKIAPSRAG